MGETEKEKAVPGQPVVGNTVTLTELLKEIEKQKIDFVAICKEIGLDTNDVALYTRIMQPEFLIVLGIAVGMLYEQKLQAKKRQIH